MVGSINIPIQMGYNLLVFLPRQLLDENHPSPKVYYIRFLSWCVFLALYNVHRQVNEINKSQNSPLGFKHLYHS
jgi:hypothetical protein